MRFKYIILIGIIFLFIRCNKNISETYLIPENYRGKVNIIFNQRSGKKPEFENGSRIYRIPTNGVLLTQFTDVYGAKLRKYIIVDINGNRFPLKILKDEDLNDSELGIYRSGTTGIYGNSNNSNSLKFQEFYLSNGKDLQNFMTDDYKLKFDERIRYLTGRSRSCQITKRPCGSACLF